MTAMNELLEDLESRTQYVVTLWRTGEEDMDREAPTNAFAFVIGKEESNALVIEGSVSGDGKSAVVTAWATTQDGEKLEPQTTVFDRTVMISQHLD